MTQCSLTSGGRQRAGSVPPCSLRRALDRNRDRQYRHLYARCRERLARADLSASPGAVGLIQAAGTLPIFLLALPAGVLADILDRRKLLMAMQVVLLAVSLALTLLAWHGLITVELLIGLTLVGGTAAAIAGPAWQSMVPDLVPRSQLRNAIALNSVGINVSRSIGPAIGGILLGAFGAAFAYAADLATYLFVIGALLWWQSPRAEGSHIPEHFLGAFRAGLRYARSSRKLHVVLFRAGVYSSLPAPPGHFSPSLPRICLEAAQVSTACCLVLSGPAPSAGRPSCLHCAAGSIPTPSS